MRKSIVILSTLIFVMMLIATPIHLSSDCEAGVVHAWFRTSDGLWENSTAHPLLRRGESFEIKIMVTTKILLQSFYVKLHEFGDPIYEVIEGPTAMEQVLEVRPSTRFNYSYIYEWKVTVRANTSWVNGYGPLEIYVQFNRDNVNDSWVNFDVMVAYIIDELWDAYSPQTFNMYISSHLDETPRISQVSIIGDILLLCVLRVFFHIRRSRQGLSRFYNGR